MARGGVTFSEVEQAALHLQDNGRVPTVDGVREYLGTGSRTTLAAHLKKWKDAQQDGTGHIPKQLASVVAALWDQLQEQANTRIATQQATFDTEITRLRQELTEAKDCANKQERLALETWQQLDDARNEALELGKKLQETTRSYEHLGLLHENTATQLDEARKENQRLHDLSRQIQKSLEHYQEAIQRQKTEDSLRQEKQQAAFRQEISLLQQNLANTEKQLTVAAKDVSQHSENAAIRQAELTSLRERHDLLLMECRERENQNLQLSTRQDMLSKQNETLKQTLESTQTLLQESRQQESALESKAKTLESALTRAEDRIVSLQHEMLFATGKESHRMSKSAEDKQDV